MIYYRKMTIKTTLSPVITTIKYTKQTSKLDVTQTLCNGYSLCVLTQICDIRIRLFLYEVLHYGCYINHIFNCNIVTIFHWVDSRKNKIQGLTKWNIDIILIFLYSSTINSLCRHTLRFDKKTFKWMLLKKTFNAYISGYRSKSLFLTKNILYR